MFAHRSDQSIETDVKEKLMFEPQLDQHKINISIQNGVVTLFGTVSSYWEKRIAERAAKSVEGVKAVANDLTVDLAAKYHRTDTEIANAVINALKWNMGVPEEKIQISVEDGDVTLTGTVEWWYQRNSAEKAIHNLAGIKSVNNLIVVRPSITSKDIKKSILQEFHRNASLEAEKINIEVKGNKVILSGKLPTWLEIKEAKRAAWSVAGVTEVENNLTLD